MVSSRMCAPSFCIKCWVWLLTVVRLTCICWAIAAVDLPLASQRNTSISLLVSSTAREGERTKSELMVHKEFVPWSVEPVL